MKIIYTPSDWESYLHLIWTLSERLMSDVDVRHVDKEQG